MIYCGLVVVQAFLTDSGSMDEKVGIDHFVDMLTLFFAILLPIPFHNLYRDTNHFFATTTLQLVAVQQFNHYWFYRNNNPLFFYN